MHACMRDEAFYDIINSRMRPLSVNGASYSSGENKIVKPLSTSAAKYESINRPVLYFGSFSILFSYCIYLLLINLPLSFSK